MTIPTWLVVVLVVGDVIGMVAVVLLVIALAALGTVHSHDPVAIVIKRSAPAPAGKDGS